MGIVRDVLLVAPSEWKCRGVQGLIDAIFEAAEGDSLLSFSELLSPHPALVLSRLAGCEDVNADFQERIAREGTVLARTYLAQNEHVASSVALLLARDLERNVRLALARQHPGAAVQAVLASDVDAEVRATLARNLRVDVHILQDLLSDTHSGVRSHAEMAVPLRWMGVGEGTFVSEILVDEWNHSMLAALIPGHSLEDVLALGVSWKGTVAELGEALRLTSR